jgi:beta-N-acetylhexosaminidase
LSPPDHTPPRAVIFAPAGPELTDTERRFFADADPLGFILFGNNCESPIQFHKLITALREAVGREDAPILIDQEGGRVARLGPPHWRAPPPAQAFAELAERDSDGGHEAAHINARMIADELAELGINVNCAPVVDLPVPGAHDVIGDRAHGKTPQMVGDLGGAVCAGFLTGGVIPVLKHIPGHGRARADSHVELPVVDASFETLAGSDFQPFRALNWVPWAMTAHVMYVDVDAELPATQSPTVIERVVRGEIGFDGILVSDDIGMQALAGSFAARAQASLAAGCDVVLHCSGKLGEMTEALSGIAPMSDVAMERLARGEALRQRSMTAAPADMADRLAALLDTTQG